MFKNLVGRKNLSLDRLATLCHVAEAGSIGAAAGEDASRQSQYSRQIAELEAFLGVALLDRTSKPFRLTSEGRELSGICRNYLSALDDFIGSCRHQTSSLVVGAGESHIQWLLIPAVLPKLRKALPQTRVVFRNLQSDEIIEALRCGEIDLGFVRRDVVPTALESAGSWNQSYRLFIPKSYGLKLRGIVNLEALAGFPMAVLEGSGLFRRTMEELIARIPGKRAFEFECSSFTQVALLVSRRECCAVLPSFARTQLDRATIDDYPVEGLEGLERVLTFAWSPRRAEIRPLIGKAAMVAAG